MRKTNTEHEWWKRFEDVDLRQTERVVLQEFGKKAVFEATDIDFVEIVAEEGTPKIVVVNATHVTALEAEWVALQPSVVRDHPGKGWAAFGGRFEEATFLGSEELTGIQFGGNEDSTVCMLRSLGSDTFEVESFTERPLEILVYSVA